jgi:hypothetical protein
LKNAEGKSAKEVAEMNEQTDVTKMLEEAEKSK